MRRALTTSDLRRTKATREEFLSRPRRPITVVLDGVSQNYNIGAIFRLCDAFLVQQLVICGTKVELHKRKLIQAAQGTQHWVRWSERQDAVEAIAEAKARGAWVVLAEQTTTAFTPSRFSHGFQRAWCLVASAPACQLKQYKQRTLLSRSQCSAWPIRSTSRPLPASCCTGFHCPLKEAVRK